MKLQLLAILPLLSYTLAKPHSLVRRAVAVGDACTQDSECDAGVVCSLTSTSTGSTVCADADVLDGSVCLDSIQCASGSCTGGLCDASGGGGDLGEEGDPCGVDGDCMSSLCSNSVCAVRNTETGLGYGASCTDSTNCKANSECGCGDFNGTPGSCDAGQGSVCLRVALGLTCSVDTDCLQYFCFEGTCIDRSTPVNDREHCNDDGNCPGPVSSAVSGSRCQCPPENLECLGTDEKICTPPAVQTSGKTFTGDACSDGAACFSGVCDGGTCSALSPGALFYGKCSTDQDCLGWTDNEGTSSAYCDDEPNDDLGMCRIWEIVPTGATCYAYEQHCFAGLDRCTQRDGGKYCDPLSTLAEEGEPCSADADCSEGHTCLGVIPNPLPSDGNGGSVSANRGISPGQCVSAGSAVIVATGGECDGTATVCYSGKDQCSSSKCLPPKTLRGAGEACSATEDCATPTTGTVTCDGITDVVGSGVCTVSNDSTGGEVTETVTTTRQVTTTINGVVTVQPQTVTLTQRVGGGGSGGGGTTRTASPVSRTASASARPSSAASRSLGEVGMAMGAVGVALAFALL